MSTNQTTLTHLKAYLFPTLVSILSMMIWYDVSEIKKDVKQLMAQSNIDKTRIDNLEKQVDRIQDATLFYEPIQPADDPEDSQNGIVYREFIIEPTRNRLTPEDDARKKPHTHA
jgi:hypothetical protein